MNDYLIDGIECRGDEAIRNFCLNYTKGKFKQDFRLVAKAMDRKTSAIELIEMLENTGHDVQPLGI